MTQFIIGYEPSNIGNKYSIIDVSDSRNDAYLSELQRANVYERVFSVSSSPSSGYNDGTYYVTESGTVKWASDERNTTPAPTKEGNAVYEITFSAPEFVIDQLAANLWRAEYISLVSGWRILSNERVYTDEMKITIEERGSLILIVVVVAIIALCVAYITHQVTYTIRKKSDNSLVEKGQVNQEKWIEANREIANNPAFTDDLRQLAASNITSGATPPAPNVPNPPSSGGSGSGGGFLGGATTGGAIVAIGILALLLTKK